MLKENINECRIVFKIKTEGPVLIKKPINKNEVTDTEDSYYRQIFHLRPNDRLPDAFFVRTLRNNCLVPYIPGSSLKGVLRSHAEMIVRTLNHYALCNIFQKKGVQKGDAIEKDLGCTYRFQILKEYKRWDIKGEIAYKNSCAICKFFGNGMLQSRVLIPDGYSDSYINRKKIDNTNNIFLAKRDGVGIDRYSGGVSGGAKFDYEVEENATFKFSEIIIKNFDLWQLGLLGYIFQDFKDKLIKIGFGKSRGLGTVSGEIEGMKIIYYGKNKPAANKICGMAQFIGNSDYYTDDEKSRIEKEVDLPDPISPVTNGYKHIYTFNSNQSYNLFGKLTETFSNEGDTGYINMYTVPPEVQQAELERIKKEANEAMTEKEETADE